MLHAVCLVTERSAQIINDLIKQETEDSNKFSYSRFSKEIIIYRKQ